MVTDREWRCISCEAVPMLWMPPCVVLINLSTNPFLLHPSTPLSHPLSFHLFFFFLCCTSPSHLLTFIFLPCRACARTSCWSLLVMGRFAGCTATSYGDKSLELCVDINVCGMMHSARSQVSLRVWIVSLEARL